MKISMPLLQDVVNYLEGRPFKEVAPMLGAIQAEYAADQKAAAEVSLPAVLTETDAKAAGV